MLMHEYFEQLQFYGDAGVNITLVKETMEEILGVSFPAPEEYWETIHEA